jgi:hypothetical protein
MAWDGRKTIIQSVVAFYAAVIGFGLQNLLNPTVSEPNDPHKLLLQNGWVCFLILASLALRLITGASIHLVVEHTGSRASPDRIGGVLLDVLTLMVFAPLLLQAAYATSVKTFFCWLCITILGSLLWFPINQLWSPSRSRKDWAFFWRNDLIHLVGTVIAFAIFCMNPGLTWYDWSPGLLLCFALTAVVTAIDLRDQIRVVGDD